jgi:hypothetical protein
VPLRVILASFCVASTKLIAEQKQVYCLEGHWGGGSFGTEAEDSFVLKAGGTSLIESLH